MESEFFLSDYYFIRSISLKFKFNIYVRRFTYTSKKEKYSTKKKSIVRWR